MKVLIWCPYINPGGGARLLSQLAPAVARQPGVDLVRLAVPEGALQVLHTQARGSCGLQIHGLREPGQGRSLLALLERNGRLGKIPGTARVRDGIRRIVLGAHYDAMRAQIPAAAAGCDLLYAFWPHLQNFPDTDLPVVCTFQDATMLAFPEIAGSATRAEWHRSDVWLKRSARVIVSSHATRDTLVRLFGASCESAAVVHHAISPSACGRDTTIEAERGLDRLDLPPRYVVCAANTTAHKNHANLLLAWSQFECRKQFPLVLFGHGTESLNVTPPDWSDHWYDCRLAGIIARKGLRAGEDFYALGYMPDAAVMDVIRSASALIMPSLAEGGGSYPVEEALSVGVPVLCSDIPVMREHLQGRTAEVAWFDPECPGAIAAALRTFFDHYQEYKRSAINAMADPRPSWDDVGREYVAVFRAVRR